MPLKNLSFFRDLRLFFYILNSTTITFICTTAAIIGDGDSKRPKSYRGNRQSTSSGLEEDKDDSMLCKTVITRDRRYITQITCYEKGSDGSSTTASEASKSSSYLPLGPASEASRLPTYGKQTQGAGAFASLFNFPSRRNGLLNGGGGGGAITSGSSLGKSSAGGSRGAGGLSMPRNRQQQQLLLTGT